MLTFRRFGMADKLALAESWRERILAQQSGGLSIRAWCKEHGVAEYLFYWWRRRLMLSPTGRESHRKKPSRAVTSMGFAEVMTRVEPRGGEARCIELPTSDSTAIRLRDTEKVTSFFIAYCWGWRVIRVARRVLKAFLMICKQIGRAHV